MKLTNLTRDVDDGDPILTGSTVITAPDGSPIATVAVNGITGLWTRQQNGSPGITLAEFDGADQIRKISGAVSIQSGNNYTGEIDRLMQVAGDGVYGSNPLALSAPGGMFVRVGVGNMLIEGTLLPVYTAQDLAVAAAHATLSRKDIIVGRLTKTGTFAGRTLLAVVTGTPAATPVAPALVNDVDTHEVKLGEILLTAAAAAVTGGMISTTGRQFSHQHSASLTVTTRAAVVAHGDGFASHTVTCSAGEVCTGGGMSLPIDTTAAGPFWTASQPSGNGWFCQTYSLRGVAFDVSCYAQCESIGISAF